MMNMFIIGAILVCLVAMLVFKSISILFKVVINIVIGAVILNIFNLIGVKFGIDIAVNPFTSFLTGFFGTPAVVILILIKIFL
ncbi:pro-sigmaK processing inhibitor BofA family protein [Peptoniphilus mikwangii]|uniref:pro-sigmaK processing inhibitor BofA family protein n=1 Tax=Peptoniphilus mikwangii TaxID=1354300 RepID=UPI0003FBFF65|nr:pro-sigmaK processing inhibitor BofA family protein [Peptoniphilus mikwangii]